MCGETKRHELSAPPLAGEARSKGVVKREGGTAVTRAEFTTLEGTLMGELATIPSSVWVAFDVHVLPTQQPVGRSAATKLLYTNSPEKIQFYPTNEEAMALAFKDLMPADVAKHLLVLLDHNDPATRGAFLEAMSQAKTTINSPGRKVALPALGRAAVKIYVSALPPMLSPPEEYYTDEELVAKYIDDEKHLRWHFHRGKPFSSLIFAVTAQQALTRRGVNVEKYKLRQIAWILFAIEWPLVNGIADGKLSNKWKVNRSGYEVMCARVKRMVEHAVLDLGVPYNRQMNAFVFPNGVFIDATDCGEIVHELNVSREEVPDKYGRLYVTGTVVKGAYPPHR
ncbi:unnamed protein product [Closterium sp. Yama58-4]|nr:unnamed protein product [Closterium sp. Yama58-4]